MALASASASSTLAVTANCRGDGVISWNRRGLCNSRSRSRCRVSCAIPSKSNVATPAEAPPLSETPRMGAECVVVGAGISGLCTAQALATQHGMWASDSILVTEARDRVGGNITTVENGQGYLWEEGPNSFQPSDAVLLAALDAGLREDLVFGDPNAPRFVFWDGRLRPVPGKSTDLPFFDLMSIPGKIRAGAGAIGLRPPPPVCVLPSFQF
jgi:protoporphyrinogen/coproporphyrinogen III oxidase